MHTEYFIRKFLVSPCGPCDSKRLARCFRESPLYMGRSYYYLQAQVACSRMKQRNMALILTSFAARLENTLLVTPTGSISVLQRHLYRGQYIQFKFLHGRLPFDRYMARSRDLHVSAECFPAKQRGDYRIQMAVATYDCFSIHHLGIIDRRLHKATSKSKRLIYFC